jgi:ATP-dependent DNA ligase
VSFTALPHSIDLIHPLRAKPFHRDGWVYEEKYDGWRIAALKEGSRVRLVSRTGRVTLIGFLRSPTRWSPSQCRH